VNGEIAAGFFDLVDGARKLAQRAAGTVRRGREKVEDLLLMAGERAKEKSFQGCDPK
jgi:hypothetical protein